jgi:hypothetical protein
MQHPIRSCRPFAAGTINAQEALAETLPAAAERLFPGQAQAALGPVIDAIRTITDPGTPGALAEAARTLAARLAPRERQASPGAVLAAIRATTDPFALEPLAQAAQALGPSPEQAQAALAAIFRAARQEFPVR